MNERSQQSIAVVVDPDQVLAWHEQINRAFRRHANLNNVHRVRPRAIHRELEMNLTIDPLDP